MPHPQLDNLVRSGELKTEHAEQSELDGLIASASKRLRDVAGRRARSGARRASRTDWSAAVNFTESAVEAAAIEWFADLGYATASGPDLLPNSGTPERASASEVVLRGRLREALARINAGLPQNAIDEALRKIEANDAVLLVDRNHRMHDALVNGIDIEYQKGDGTDDVKLRRLLRHTYHQTRVGTPSRRRPTINPFTKPGHLQLRRSSGVGLRSASDSSSSQLSQATCDRHVLSRSQAGSGSHHHPATRNEVVATSSEEAAT